MTAYTDAWVIANALRDLVREHGDCNSFTPAEISLVCRLSAMQIGRALKHPEGITRLREIAGTEVTYEHRRVCTPVGSFAKAPESRETTGSTRW